MQLTLGHQKEIDLSKIRFLRLHPRDIVRILSVKYIRDNYSSSCDRYEVTAIVNSKETKRIIPRELVALKTVHYEVSSSSSDSSDSDD